MSDLPPLSLSVASARLSELRLRGRHMLAACAGLLVLGAGAWAVGSADLAFALAAGAVASLIISGMAVDERRRLLLALIVQGDANAIVEVAALADHLAHDPAERRRVAAKLRAAADRGQAPTVHPMVLDPGRGTRCAPRLNALADAIADERRAVTPGAVALCRRLVSDGTSSPLYNPHMSELDLERVLTAVESGISPAVAALAAE